MTEQPDNTAVEKNLSSDRPRSGGVECSMKRKNTQFPRPSMVEIMTSVS